MLRNWFCFALGVFLWLVGSVLICIILFGFIPYCTLGFGGIKCLISQKMSQFSRECRWWGREIWDYIFSTAATLLLLLFLLIHNSVARICCCPPFCCTLVERRLYLSYAYCLRIGCCENGPAMAYYYWIYCCCVSVYACILSSEFLGGPCPYLGHIQCV